MPGVSPKPPEEEKAPVEVEVTVGGVVDGTACPYLQFESTEQAAPAQNQVGATYRRFGTDRLTRYEGGLCDDIGVGAKLRVSGTKRKQDEAVHVSAIVFKAKKTPPVVVSGHALVMMTLDGTQCPALSFKLVTYASLVNESSTHTVHVTDKTTYDAGSCENIKAGSTVTFSGEKRADGSVVILSASVKEAKKEGKKDEGVPQLVEIGLKVSAVSADAACPLLVFKAGSYSVKTSVDTEYVDGTCSQIAAGSRLLVSAVIDAQVSPQRKAVPKTLLATRIQFLAHETAK